MGLFQQPTYIFDTEVYLHRQYAGGIQFDSNGSSSPTEFDIVSTSGQRSILGMKVSGDTNYRTIAYGDATLAGFEFGPGNAGRDVVLARTANGVLKLWANGTSTATNFIVESISGQRPSFSTSVGGDTVSRLWMEGSATVIGFELGSGSAARDVSFRRTAAGFITFDTLSAAAATQLLIQSTSGQTNALGMTVAGDSTTRLILTGDATTTGLYMGPGNAARDTNWYRGGVGILKTEHAIWLNSASTIRFGTTQTPTIGSSSTTKLEISGRLYLDAASAASSITDGALTYSSSGAGGLNYKSIEMGDGVQVKFVTPVGWQTVAFPVGLGSIHTFATAMSMPINGGSVMAPILVIAPMKLSGYTIMNRDTSGAHTYEARLFVDTQNNSTTGLFVSGTDATFTFTPAAVGPVSSNGGTLNTTPVVIAKGLYWLIVRNTSASVAGNMGGLSSPADTLGASVTDVGLLRTLATALSTAPTLHVAGGWTKTRAPGMALRGRVLGEAAIW